MFKKKPSTPCAYGALLCAMPMVLLLLFLVYRAAGAPFSDYAGYYFGSWEIWRGHFQTAYDTQALNLAIAKQGYSGVFVSYTPFPPFTAMLFAPLLLLPVAVSKLVFAVVSAALFVFTLIRCIRFFQLPRWLLVVVPVIFLVPIRNNIFFGQSYLLLTVLLLEGFIAYKKGRWWLCGLLWSVAILFKIFPVLIFFFLLIKKQYKPVIYSAGCCAVLGIVSLLCTGWDAWMMYLSLLPRLNNGELNDGYTYVFQSAFMLLKNLLVFDPAQNTRVVMDSPALFVVLMALYKAAILGICVGVTMNKKVSELMAFAVWIMGSMLISPNGSSYSLILLLIPLLAWTKEKPEQRSLLWMMAILFVACSLPVQWFANLPIPLQYPRLYLLLIALLLITGIRLPWKPALAFVALFLLLDARKFLPVSDQSDYLLKKPTPLIYELAVQDGKLTYTYWDTKGSHSNYLDYAIQSYTELPIQNNQLFYKGKQLTNTNDWKKKAWLVNNNQIIYLSDLHRGVGFYTLRYLKVN